MCQDISYNWEFNLRYAELNCFEWVGQNFHSMNQRRAVDDSIVSINTRVIHQVDSNVHFVGQLPASVVGFGLVQELFLPFDYKKDNFSSSFLLPFFCSKVFLYLALKLVTLIK